MVRVNFYKVLFCLLSLCYMFPVKAEKNKGNLNNLVCFVRFADEYDIKTFERSFSDYELLFNDDKAGANSVYKYFSEASYGQLSWKSIFFPAATDGNVVSYCTTRERGFYKEKSSINPTGYEDALDKAAREQALVREIADWLSDELPDEIMLDADDNGIIDNLCIVLSGNSELGSSHLLWPHRSDLALPDEKAIYIKNKKLVGYLIVFDEANGWSSLKPIPLNTGVICHEMSHSLGTYDLYHVNDDLNPVGVWDLMSDNQLVPQHMSAYTKFRYCGWLDELPEISAEGRYELSPLGGVSPDNVAYKIKPVGYDEYFVVEYRRKEGSTFDNSLPESGLLVYRINPAYTGGNVNYNGTTRLDEVYIFRPGGSVTEDGDVNKAALSKESGRVSFGGDAEIKPFYSDGATARFAITDISSCGETISFNLDFLGNIIKLSNDTLTFSGGAEKKQEIYVETDIDWSVEGVPEWLSVTQNKGEAGKTIITLETLSDNTTSYTREAKLVFTSPYDSSLKEILVVRQLSDIILPPSDLHVFLNENGEAELTWSLHDGGKLLLADGFEDSSTIGSDGWIIDNKSDRGWSHMESDNNNYLPYNGRYSMYMKSAWVDIHQDERLVSPLFAYGKKLSFMSKSIAPQKNIKNQYYYVEVSSDGGATWKPVYDLVKDCNTVNQYTKITIDLSDYASEQMRVAFHAYDTNDIGLSYWWQIDDVNIYTDLSDVSVEKYAVYRNGVKLGETSEAAFTDKSPCVGENIYTVRALGSFGESSDSEPCILVYTPSGVNTTVAEDVNVRIEQGNIFVSSSLPLKRVRIISLSGVQTANSASNGNEYIFDTSLMKRGLYFVVCDYADNRPGVVRKILFQ